MHSTTPRVTRGRRANAPRKSEPRLPRDGRFHGPLLEVTVILKGSLWRSHGVRVVQAHFGVWPNRLCAGSRLLESSWPTRLHLCTLTGLTWHRIEWSNDMHICNCPSGSAKGVVPTRRAARPCHPHLHPPPSSSESSSFPTGSAIERRLPSFSVRISISNRVLSLGPEVTPF